MIVILFLSSNLIIFFLDCQKLLINISCFALQ